ncbi:DNA glycosylase, partial [Chiua virens]
MYVHRSLFSREDRGDNDHQPSTSDPEPDSTDLASPHVADAETHETWLSIASQWSYVVHKVLPLGSDRDEQPWPGQQGWRRKQAHIIVRLRLGHPPQDEQVYAAIKEMRSRIVAPVGIGSVLEADENTISDAIAKVGFWRRKTQYIKQTAQRLHDDFDSDVPKTVDELCSLPGVGPKMAFLALQVAWKLNVGIGVDVHVHRITNRLGWHNKPTKNPEETRLNLQSWLPKELHGEINHTLVGFGQTICLPIGPKCGDCTLSTGGLCPSVQSTRNKTSKAAVGKKLSKSDCAEISGPKIEIEIEIPKNQDPEKE